MNTITTVGNNPNQTRIFWASDSTVQANTITTYPQTGMGQVFPMFLSEGVTLVNLAKNGRSTKSFITDGRLEIIEQEIKSGDFLFIQFGHNDEKREDPERWTEPNGSYIENLMKFINVAREKGATPVFITSLSRRSFDEEGKLEESTHRVYGKAMLSLAEKEKVLCYDLGKDSFEFIGKLGDSESQKLFMQLKEGEYFNYPQGLKDNTHLKYEGAITFAKMIAKGLWNLDDSLKGVLCQWLEDGE